MEIVRNCWRICGQSHGHVCVHIHRQVSHKFGTSLLLFRAPSCNDDFAVPNRFLFLGGLVGWQLAMLAKDCSVTTAAVPIDWSNG